MKISKNDTELAKVIIEQFHAHNIPVVQVHPETKIPMWKKWQDTTVDKSKKSIDFSINSNFGIINGPIDDKTTVFTIDFDCFNKTTKSYDQSIQKKFGKIIQGIDYDGLYESGTCKNYCLLVHSTNKEINDFLQHSGKKLVFKGEQGGEIEILPTRKQYTMIPPSISKCKKHGNICRQRKFMNGSILKFITDEDQFTAAPILNLLDEIVEAEESKCPVTTSKTPPTPPTKYHCNSPSTHSNADEIQQLLDIIDPQYCDAREDWMKIGMAIKTELGENGYEVFDKWSRKSWKYDELENSKQWDSYKQGPITVGTLRHYAKLSNKEKYSEWKSLHYPSIDEIEFIETDDLQPAPAPHPKTFMKSNSALPRKKKASDYFKTLDEMGETQFAQLFLDLLGEDKNKYIYFVQDKEQCFYVYNEHNILSEYKTIPTVLSGQITEELLKHLKTMYHKFVDTDPDSKDHDYVYKIYKKLRKKFSNPTFKKGVIEELKIFIQDLGIKDKTDKKQHLLAFKNQCFDFQLRKYRPIAKDDYVKTHITYDLPGDDTKIQKELKEIVKSFFDDTSLETYLYDSLGFACFTNKFEKFNIWTGCGSNGKGVLMALIQNAFDSYFYAADNKFLTGSIKSGQSDSSLYNCQGKKIVMVSEPQKSETSNVKFNIEKIKSLTGRDSQTCRTLYATNVTFRPSFTLFCQCNQIPSLDKVENAIKRRFVCLPFNHKFCENPILPHEKAIDVSLKDKINDPKYYTQFIKILISHMMHQEDGDDPKPRCDKKLVVPEKILEKTNNYLEENNDVKAFLEEFYQFTDKNDRTKENFVSLKDLYGHYRDTGGTSSKSTFKYNMESNGFGYEIWKPYFDGKRITKRGFFGLKVIVTGVDFIETSDLKNQVDILDKY